MAPGRPVPSGPPRGTASWWPTSGTTRSPPHGLGTAAAPSRVAVVKLQQAATPESDLQVELEIQAREPHRHFLEGQEDSFRDVELRIRELNRRAQLAAVTSAGSTSTEQGGAARRLRGRTTADAAGADDKQGDAVTRSGDGKGPAGGDQSTSRVADLGHRQDNDLFVSHCWRDPGTQELKRRLITELSKISEGGTPGMTYWADFLDLYAEGPMPWRDEIVEAIKASAKFVAFIDYQFVVSYNCLMELAVAIRHNKPIVPVIIEDQAWMLLTNPIGADVAWQASVDLRSHEGSTMGGKMPTFGMVELRKLFHSLGSINFCPCRPVDFVNLGEANVLRGFLSDVRKDILYLKEHTELSRRAVKWNVNKHRHHLLQGEEVSDWVKWCSQAERYRQEPAPTELQKTYVHKSKTHLTDRKRSLTILAIAVAVMVLGGAIMSVVMAIRADKAATTADKAKLAAEDAAAEALAQEAIAIAEKQAVLVWNLLYKGSEMKFVDSYLTLKFLRRALQLLPGTNSKPLEARAVALFRSVLGHAGQQAPCIGSLPKDDPSTAKLSFDPSGRMLAVDDLRDVIVWDVSGGTTQSWRLTGHSTPVTTLSWANDGLVLASGEASGTIFLWQTEDGEQWDTFQTLEGHTDNIRYMVFAPGSKAVLCSCSKDQTVRIWRGLDSETVTVQVIQINSIVDGASWRPDGLALAVKSRSNKVSIFSILDSGASAEVTQMVTLDDPSLLLRNEPAYSPDGTQISVLLLSQDTVIVNLTSGAELHIPAMPGSAGSSFGHTFWFPPDPSTLLGGGHLILQAKSNRDVWVGQQIHGGSWLASTDIATLDAAIRRVLLSPDGHHLLAVTRGGTVHLCDLRNPTAGCLERNYGNAFPSSIGWTGSGFRFLTANGEVGTDGLVPEGGARRLLQRPALQQSTVPVEFAVEWSTDGVITGLPLDPPVPAHIRQTMSADASRFAYSVKNEAGMVGVVTFATNGTNSEIRLSDGQNIGGFQDLAFSPSTEMLVACYPTADGAFFSVFNITSRTSSFNKIHRSDQITDVQWAPDGLTVAILTSNPAVHIYSLLENGSPVLEQLISWDVADRMAWSPDGRDIALTKGGVIELWRDVRSGAGELRTIDIGVDNRATAIAYMPDGLSVVLGMESGELRLLHLNGAPDKSLRLRGHQTQVQEMALSSGSRNLVASAGVSGSIRVWDANTAARAGIRDLQGHESSVFTVAFSPQGGLMASASKDGTLRVWNHSNSQLWNATGAPTHGSWIISLAWAGDSQDFGPWGIVTGCEDGSVWAHVFNGEGPLETRQMTKHTGKVTSVQWWSMAKPVLSVSHDSTLMLWKPMETDSTPVVLTGHAGPVTAANYHPWGDYLASGSADGTARIWLLIEETSSYGETLQELAEHWGPILAVAYSPDGHRLVTSSADGEVRLYSTPAGGYAILERLIVSHKAPVASVAFAPNSLSLVTGSWDGDVYLHQLAEQNLTVALEGTQGLVGQVVFSPDGKWVAAASDGSSYNHPRGPLNMWDVSGDDSDNIQVYVLEGHAINRVASVAFSPDSNWIAYGTDDYSVRVTELVGSEVHLERLCELMVGDMDLTQEEVLHAGLPSQVLDPAI